MTAHRIRVPDGISIVGYDDIDFTPAPRLSWVIPDAEAGFEQSAYEIELARAGAAPETFVVESSEQVLVPWPGRPLASRESAQVRVRVRGDAEWSDWSEPAVVAAGLLAADDWTARFVSPVELGGMESPAPLLAAVVDLPGDLVRPRLYATAHGVYEATINGERVGDHVLAPGWTTYSHRLRYQTYDVTDLLRPGQNEIEVLLGNGWYRGRLGFQGGRAMYGDRLALLAQLEVTTRTARSTRSAPTSPGPRGRAGSWPTTSTTGSGPTCASRADERAGAGRGARRRPVAPGGAGRPAGAGHRDPAAPSRCSALPVGQRRLVDFGQNLVGWVRLTRPRRARATEIVVRHAEVLEDGELGDPAAAHGEGHRLLHPGR